MDNDEIQGKKFSEFPSVTPGSADEVVGLHAGDNARFTVANFILAIRQGLANLFVPLTRTINNKALSSDITLEASDVGAVDADDVGVAGGVAGLDASGKVPISQLPPIASTAADVTYDNTQSGLTADDVQEAIDELAAGAGGGGVDPETIAPVEESTTATVSHSLGSIFYLSDVLYRALSDIAVGDTINTGSGGNATQTTVAANFSRIVKLTSAQYATLSAAEKAADIIYIITDDYIDADDVNYDPTSSGLSATNVQDAIDEVVTDLGGKQDTITANGILKGDGAGGVSAAVAGTDYATPSQLEEKAKYTQYYITTVRTVTHTFDKSCMFVIMTERISTGSNPQSDEFGFGYCSITNAQTNRYHQIHAPTSDPVTITPGQGYLTITPSVTNTRITIIEFTDNV